MSLEALGWAAKYRGPMAVKIVLVGLANAHNHEHGRCDPSFRYLAEWCGCSRRNVIRAIERLEATGLIRITARERSSHRYTLNLEIDPVAAGGDRESPERAGSHGAPQSPPGAPQSPPGAPQSPPGDSQPIAGDPQSPPGDSQSGGGDPVAPKTGRNQEGEPGSEPGPPSGVCAAPLSGTAPAAGSAEAFTVESRNHPNPIRPKDDDSAPVILIPLVNSNGRPFAVTDALANRWMEAYPAVDVLQTLRAIREWNLSNPTQRKTPAGVVAHVSKWLAKEQNRGSRGGRAAPAGAERSRAGQALDALEGAKSGT